MTVAPQFKTLRAASRNWYDFYGVSFFTTPNQNPSETEADEQQEENNRDRETPILLQEDQDETSKQDRSLEDAVPQDRELKGRNDSISAEQTAELAPADEKLEVGDGVDSERRMVQLRDEVQQMLDEMHCQRVENQELFDKITAEQAKHRRWMIYAVLSCLVLQFVSFSAMSCFLASSTTNQHNDEVMSTLAEVSPNQIIHLSGASLQTPIGLESLWHWYNRTPGAEINNEEHEPDKTMFVELEVVDEPTEEIESLRETEMDDPEIWTRQTSPSVEAVVTSSAGVISSALRSDGLWSQYQQWFYPPTSEPEQAQDLIVLGTHEKDGDEIGDTKPEPKRGGIVDLLRAGLTGGLAF